MMILFLPARLILVVVLLSKGEIDLGSVQSEICV